MAVSADERRIDRNGRGPIIVRERKQPKNRKFVKEVLRLIRAKNYDDMSLKVANIIAAQVS